MTLDMPKVMDRAELGARIRAKRTELGLTVREVGAKAGVDFSYVSYVERGQRNVSFDKLSRITSALGIDIQGESTPDPTRAAVIDRFARVAPFVPEDEIDVFVHELALWEKRYMPRE